LPRPPVRGDRRADHQLSSPADQPAPARVGFRRPRPGARRVSPRGGLALSLLLVWRRHADRVIALGAFAFELVTTDGAARRGRMRTAHGDVDTPAFMPVATQGTVKSLTPADLRTAGVQIVLSNTYHLFLRPGHEVVRELGGLHRFMGWDGPILTDSGGFQVFSLSGLRKITEDGVEFRSHVDGSARFLSPETCVQTQHALGSDVLQPLDECLAPPSGLAETERSLALTLRWLRRCVEPHRRGEGGGALFGIVQGGISEALRRRAVEETCAFD